MHSKLVVISLAAFAGFSAAQTNSTSTLSPTDQCIATRNACDRAPGANHSFCASNFGGCITNACIAIRNACDTAPDANHSLCASNFSGCTALATAPASILPSETGSAAASGTATMTSTPIGTVSVTTTSAAPTAVFTGGANTLSGKYAGLVAIGGVLALV